MTSFYFNNKIAIVPEHCNNIPMAEGSITRATYNE